MMGFMSYDDFCKLLGILRKSIEDLAKMNPEERDAYYKTNRWSNEDDDLEYYTGEDLMMFWDDRWMKDK